MQHKITDIEEMARDIANTSCPKKPCEECNWCGSASEAIDCTMFLLAEELYNEGYRKASEVAREIFEEMEKLRCIFTYPSFRADGTIFNKTDFNFHMHIEDYAELKKKYTKERKRK